MNGDRPASTYRNPFWPGRFADPFLLKVRGHYYAYATEGDDRPADGAGVFPILSSPDMVNWTESGTALAALGDPFFRYWAPEVTADNGRYLLYYAVHTAEFNAGIRVAVAEQPWGPFVDSGCDLTSALFPWAIDPHVFRDVDGHWYLFMTVEMWDDPSGLIGVGNVVDRLVDPFTLSGRPGRVTPPRHAWELFEAQRPEKGGVDWYCVEGPAVMRHRGRYYELFSGGCYYRDNYAVSYATAPAPMGRGGMPDEAWQDWEPDGRPGWLMHGDPAHAIGPGHNSLVYGPNNADLYIAYHAWPPDMPERRPCLDRLFWHGDVPWTPAPTFLPQPAPRLPRLRALCDPAATLPSGWQAQGGQWSAAAGQVTQTDTAATVARMRAPDALGAAWVLEVNLRHRAGSGSYGIALATPAGSETCIAIEPTGALAIWSGDAEAEATRRVPLPAGVVPAAWHQLLLTYAGTVLTVTLDGLPLLDTVAADLTGAWSLWAHRCSAAFGGISLTDHFRDEFLGVDRDAAQLGWRTERTAAAAAEGMPVSWRVRSGALEQADSGPGDRSLYKGASHHTYEYGATLRLLHPPADEQGAWGLVAWSSAQGRVLALLTRGSDGWSLVVRGEGAAAGVDVAAGLAAGFDPCGWHTIRVVCEQGKLVVCLDGPEVATVAVPRTPGAVGLITRAVMAAYTGVWHTAYAI